MSSYIPGYTSAVITPRKKNISGSTAASRQKAVQDSLKKYNGGTGGNTAQEWWGTGHGVLPSDDPPPPGPVSNPYGGVKTSGGGGRGGGGGGGLSATQQGQNILGLLNRHKPQQQKWKDLAFEEYVPSKFRDFNSGKYDLLRSGLTDAIGADRTAGNAQYAQLAQEMGAYQNPWADPTPQTTNPAMSTAMQRMFNANNTPTDFNQATTNEGIQADQGFGNLLAVLGTAASQDQASRLRSNAGYQRNLNERLDAEQRGGMLGLGMAEAQARELYEQEKWEFGEEVAQMNYAARTQNQQYNNQGQNAASSANVQGNNDWNQSAVNALIDMVASGAKIDPNAWTPFTGA